MRDCEKLAKALRCCHLTSGRGCAECPRRSENNDSCYKLLLDAADAIEELLAAVPKWISVEEQLPELYAPVLVAYIGYNTGSILSDMTAYRDGDGDWCWYDGDFPSGDMCKVEVTHWMPLPEPPKEDV